MDGHRAHHLCRACATSFLPRIALTDAQIFPTYTLKSRLGTQYQGIDEEHIERYVFLPRAPAVLTF